MRTVSLKTLKNRLRHYLRLVAAGETVQVTDRGRVVAELVPPRAGDRSLLGDARWAEAVRKGWITPAAIVSDEPPPRMPVMSFETLMRDLSADRSDR